ncbi:MAG TPA: uroporphyrinogen-III C-methyltransferase [Accumulibacter sp.]|nr:uroporphyrinogen-III C-methyltransferase [Accumulibacter sp.]
MADLDPSTAARPASTGFSRWQNPWLVVVLLALALVAWQWLETRQLIADTQKELAQRLAHSDTANAESRVLASQAQEQTAAVLARIGALEARLAESRSQQLVLETLYQDLARNRDEWVLAEVEQGVTLAAQQLQLAGNIQGAVLALQTADARLAGSNRPQFIGLPKVLARDLDRLRALPQLDTAVLSQRIESVLLVIDTLPLAVDGQPRNRPKALPPDDPEAADEPNASPLGLAFWRRLGGEFWQEVKGLIRIQRFDRDEPVLLAPGQEFFLRENLKLRLLNARLALLARDQPTFRNELSRAQSWLERHFNAHDPGLQHAQATLRRLASTEINIELPTLNESLAAIKTFKVGKERK